MAKVNCENISCIHNSSNKPASLGQCTNPEINLIYKSANDDEIEYLDCKEFKWKKGLGYNE